ncbi:transcriptional repressor [Tepidibacter hydrothermalis]|uniref:Transcriptional repressor n=1 Tax=Tepidibacter hydrothermalis TaxID=3036126 RepID=A0ABY8EHF4_9FIRM|nr:transcriptional repressor [Tepidibacter hydrothermalis]WFD12397.1 transcriptional repressor [Tepidibacter hydrothermalis]
MNLSKNKSTIYRLFKENPNKELDINDVLTLIDEENEKISKRTVYRAIDKLIDVGKIYCSSIRDRKRKFKLSDIRYCEIICNKCHTLKKIKIKDSEKFKKYTIGDKSFDITGGYIKFYGTCSKCLEKT